MEFIFYMGYFFTCRGRLLGRFLAVIACILYGVGTACGATYTCISNGSRTLTIPSMTVMRDAAIGSEIMTVSASNVVAYGCAVNSASDKSYGEFFGVRGYGVPAGQINGRNIYVLGSAATGVGYAIYAATQDVKSYITAGDNELDVSSNATTLGASNRTASALRLTFYKIGPITIPQSLLSLWRPSMIDKACHWARRVSILAQTTLFIPRASVCSVLAAKYSVLKSSCL